MRAVLFDDGQGGEDPGAGSVNGRAGRRGSPRWRQGKTYTWHSREVVGAAGCRCPVATALVEETTARSWSMACTLCRLPRVLAERRGCGPDVGDIENVDSIITTILAVSVSEGVVNVGIGMVIGLMDKQKKKPRRYKDVIANHPLFKERFANATMIEAAPGWQRWFPAQEGVPTTTAAAGSGIRLVHAASLVDPSGEGVSNALVTGEMAARHIVEGLARNLHGRDVGHARPELTNSYRMQKLSRRA